MDVSRYLLLCLYMILSKLMVAIQGDMRENRCSRQAVEMTLSKCQEDRQKLSQASQTNDAVLLCGALQRYSDCMWPRILHCEGPAKMAFDVIASKYARAPYSCQLSTPDPQIFSKPSQSDLMEPTSPSPPQPSASSLGLDRTEQMEMTNKTNKTEEPEYENSISESPQSSSSLPASQDEENNEVLDKRQQQLSSSSQPLSSSSASPEMMKLLDASAQVTDEKESVTSEGSSTPTRETTHPDASSPENAGVPSSMNRSGLTLCIVSFVLTYVMLL